MDDQYRQQRRLNPIQAEADRLRGTGRWQRVRRQQLARQPLCADCLAAGVTRVASDVDHVVPVRDLVVRGTPLDAFNLDVLQSVCRSCHNVRTARERRERSQR